MDLFYQFSYTAALGVTVGIGCFLLMVNLVIFMGIYYQREQSRKKRKSNKRMSPHDSLSEGLFQIFIQFIVFVQHIY